MASEEYSRLQSQIFRYGHNYDQNVDQYCPPLVKTKKGEIAKRQPKVPPQNVQYWKAQCSFRGLKTTGRIEELRDRVRNRDKARDAGFKLEHDRIKHLLDLQGQKLQAEENERHWHDPETSLDEKARIDAYRALKEHLELNNGIRQSSMIIKAASKDLVDAATKFGLACQIVKAPNSMVDRFELFNAWSRLTVIGHATAVAATATKLAERAAHDQRQQELAEQREEAERQAALLAEKEEKIEKRRALLAKAKEMQDWDITGVWEVHCDTLAHYTSEEPAELSMEIFRDDFAFDSNGRPYSEDSEDSEDEQDYYDPQPRVSKAPAARRPDMPKFCASFNFSILEGHFCV
ncbi:hypothetical protein HII31_00586 [Pseudocercospora fuligena]|uniref:Uncharacterized protein n=1 Tax=Pseudocercospora fuligena TaxID=685502 RepID=A0A8H6VTH4_9PEZI|nr:hypothetical protein HII31_00586 [Pseudocercospora fuligena]